MTHGKAPPSIPPATCSATLKVSNEQFEAAWRERLKTKAGFKFVSRPMPMTTKTKSVIYYLYFASQKPVAANIVDDIFNKYRQR